MKPLRFALFSLLLAVALWAPPAAADEDDKLSGAQRQEVEKMIRDVLMKNPEIIIEAVRVYEAKREEEKRKAQAHAAASMKPHLEKDPFSPIMGNAEGDVTLVEFFDYQCGFCKRVFPTLQKLVDKDTKLRVVMKEFPILGEVSVYAARAALASHKQGKYNEYHAALMELKGRLNVELVMTVAEKVGLDIEKLKQDMEQDKSINDSLRRNVALARALDINGTPAFVIDGQVIPGAADYETLKELVDMARSGEEKPEG